MKYSVSMRLSVLAGMFRYQQYWEKETLISKIEDKGFPYSERTFHRDLNKLRTDLGLEVVYHSVKGMYHLDQSKSVVNSDAFNIIDLFNTTEFLKEGLNEPEDFSKFIQLDGDNMFRGSEHLSPILEAIVQSKKINFKYVRYHNELEFDVDVFPIWIKKHGHRWYFLGLRLDKPVLRTYGLDRIVTDSVHLGEGLSVDLKPYEEEIQTKKMLYGVDTEILEKEEVLFRCGRVHKSYLQGLPMHESQNITALDSQTFEVRLNLVLTNEFKTDLLKSAPYITLIKPDHLVKEFSEVFQSFLGPKAP